MELIKKSMVIFLSVCLVGLFFIGCSDQGGTFEQSDVNRRVYLMTAESAVLTFSNPSSGVNLTTNEAGQESELSLVLENVSEDLLWVTDRPAHDAGGDTLDNYLETIWPDIYGRTSPNAILDAYLPADGEVGLFLILSDPQYDPTSRKLDFKAALLGSTLDSEPSDPLTLEKVKITIMDNSPDQQDGLWSFVQVATAAHFEMDESTGTFKLHLNNVAQETYYLGNAPNRRYYLYSVGPFSRDWTRRFNNIPPNAMMTSYLQDGELKTHILTLTDPVYDPATDRLTYKAESLLGDIQTQPTLYNPTLFIDDVSSTGKHTVQVHNNCQNTGRTVWLGASGNCKSQDNPCPEFFDPPSGANAEIGPGESIVFHVDTGWEGRFWPRTGCNFDAATGLCPDPAINCCDTGGCTNKDNHFALECFTSGVPPVTVSELAFDAPGGTGPYDTIDVSMVDGFNVPMSILPVTGTYNSTPDPGQDPKLWCQEAGCSKSPPCPDFLLTDTGVCQSPCLYALNNLIEAEQEKYCCKCSMTTACTCPDACCEDHYGCTPYHDPPYPDNMICNPWNTDTNRAWAQEYIDYIQNVHQHCPGVYAWQFDDLKSTYTCRKDNGLVDYKITFCP